MIGIELDSVRAVTRAEIRRSWRSFKSSDGRLIASGISGLFLLPVVPALLAGFFFAGRIAGSGELDIELVRLAAVVIWCGLAGYIAIYFVGNGLGVERLDGLLTAVSHRTVISGVLAAKLFFLSLFVGPVVLLGSFVFGIGAGSIAAAPLLGLACLLLVGTAFPTGVSIALAARNVSVRSRLLTRFRPLAWLGLSLGFVILYGSNSVSTMATARLKPIVLLLASTPLGWFGDLAVASVHPDASILFAAAAFAFGAALLVAVVPVVGRLAGWLWYADDVTIEHETSVDVSEPPTSVLDRLFPSPLVGVVLTDLRRARRAPVSFFYLFYPFLFFLFPLVNTIDSGEVSYWLPFLGIFSVAWASGAAFTLNVLGDEGAALPATALTSDAGRRLVGGHVLAGLLFGLPLVVVLVAVLGALGPHPGTVPRLVLCGVVVTASAPPIATGIGCKLPRFEAMSVARNSEAVVPSVFAFVCYSIVLTIVSTPALLANVLGSEPITRLGLAGTGITAVLAVLAGGGSLLVAVRSVENHQFG